MSTFHPGRCAIDEFSFRYLSPPDACVGTRALDPVERAHQAGAGADTQDGPAIDLAPLFRALVTGTAPAGGTRDRLLALLLQVHQPATVTPSAGYGVHASYPSPRAYYPLRFVLQEGDARWQVDMRALRLRPECATAMARAPLALELRCDFTRYAPLYNLFRKSLFALEAGHFLSELAALAPHAGLRIAPVVGGRSIRLDVHDDGAPADWREALRAHQRYARERNSGRFYGGFYPAPCLFDAPMLDGLLAALAAAQTALAKALPRAPGIGVRLCLRAGEGVAAGVYRIDGGTMTCVDPRDPVDACERHYNYDNFNFRTVPAVLFLCVDELAYHCNDDTFLEMNMALGYLNQQLIRHLSGHGLVGRPFRSYDQRGIDALLQTPADGQRAYYGLMVARNRCREAWGVLR